MTIFMKPFIQSVFRHDSRPCNSLVSALLNREPFKVRANNLELWPACPMLSPKLPNGLISALGQLSPAQLNQQYFNWLIHCQMASIK